MDPTRPTDRLARYKIYETATRSDQFFVIARNEDYIQGKRLCIFGRYGALQVILLLLLLLRRPTASTAHKHVA